jgi:hypothetical protein
MAEDYTYDPRTISPVLAGLAAGSVGAIAASLLALPIDSPNETTANPITVTILAMVIGVISGGLWRMLRAQRNGSKKFVWSMVGGLFAVLSALAIIEWTAGGGWFTYAGLVAAVIFLSVTLLIPVVSRAVGPTWAALIPVFLAAIVALGLYAG